MTSRLNPQLVDLVYEASLRAYWRKNSLKRFLRSVKISEKFLATLSSSETKRVWLDRLFHALQKNDAGRSAVRRMADDLAQMEAFPDLQGWEDSDDKILLAKSAVRELRAFLKKESVLDEAEARKKRKREQAQKNRKDYDRSEKTREMLHGDFESLSDRIGTSGGGYDFEKWFYRLMDYSEIQSRPPYTHEGRQVDGAITLEGTTYLVELKFTRNQVSATDIDSLQAKVHRKADNTMGVMVSVSGYSSVAIDSASFSRTTLLLLDYQHLFIVLRGQMSFQDVLLRLRRHSSQTGVAYLNASDF